MMSRGVIRGWKIYDLLYIERLLLI